MKCGFGDVSMGENLKDSGEEVRSLERGELEQNDKGFMLKTLQAAALQKGRAFYCQHWDWG